MKTAVKVGTMDLGNGFEDMWVLRESGEVIVSENIQGNVYVSDVILDNPTGFVSDGVAIDVCKAMKAEGVALTADWLVTFRDGLAEFRNPVTPNVVDHTVDYDTEAVCEENITWEM